MSYLKKKVIALSCLLLILTGCSKANTEANIPIESIINVSQNDVNYDDNVIYRNENVNVTFHEPLKNPQFVDNIWQEVTESILFDCDMIAKVTIQHIEEVSIEYTYMDTECTSYKTLATVTLDSAYYSSDGITSDKFTIAIPNSTFEFDESFPTISEGGTYIMFMTYTQRLNDSLQLDKYSDYYVSSPADIVEIRGVNCNSDSLFQRYSTKSTSEKDSDNNLLEGEILINNNITTFSNKSQSSADRYNMPLMDFESMLKSKIDILGGNKNEE